MRLKVKVLVSKSLLREVGLLSSESPNILDISYLPVDDHTNPDSLQHALQGCVDKIDQGSETFDAIVLGYGLCGGGICGVSSERFPLVAPRVHNNAALLLGNSGRFRELFDRQPDAFWFTPGYFEYNAEEMDSWQKRRMNAACVRLPQITTPACPVPAHAEYCGDDTLLRDLLGGAWDNARFLVIPPRHTCRPSFRADLIRLAEIDGE